METVLYKDNKRIEIKFKLPVFLIGLFFNKNVYQDVGSGKTRASFGK